MSTSYAGDWSDAQPQFKPAESRSDARRREEQALARLAFVARVMDSAVRIPGVNIRFGVDAALGLVPAIGDMLAGAVAAWIVFEARRLGAPLWLATGHELRRLRNARAAPRGPLRHPRLSALPVGADGPALPALAELLRLQRRGDPAARALGGLLDRIRAHLPLRPWRDARRRSRLRGTPA